MGVQRAQEDVTIKEMARWEHRDVWLNGTYIQAIPVADGGKKDMPRAEYDKMLYQAESAMGGARISGYKIVKSDAEELIAVGQGWSVTQEDAIEAVGRRDLERATLAANRANNDKWMSGGAKAEAQAVDEATIQHLPEIPETPIVRRQAKETR